jgi:hypothetical protein
MAVPSYEMSAEQIHENIMTQFKHHVENYELPQSLANMPRNNFFMTTKHLAESVTDKDIHTLTSLWRKYATIKRYVNNIITRFKMSHMIRRPPSHFGSHFPLFVAPLPRLLSHIRYHLILPHHSISYSFQVIYSLLHY